MTEIAPTIIEEHTRAVLLPRGLDPAKTAAAGVYSVTRLDDLPDDLRGSRYATVPGLVFPWNSPTGGTVVQYRPDNPRENDKGAPVKYLFPGGSQMVLNRLRDPGADSPLLVAEGTCQSLAAAQYTHPAWAVYGMSGCWSWRQGETQVAIPDLIVCEGRDVVIALDADAATNRAVYDAGMALKAAIMAEGAHSVKFLRLSGAGKKAGLDDVLGGRSVETRAAYLSRLLERAEDKPADRAPARKKSSDKAELTSGGFIDSSAGGLQVVRLADAVTERSPLLLTLEDKLAVYREGVFRSDKTALPGVVGELLGEQYRTAHVANVESFLIGRLGGADQRTPEHADSALLNVRNGMLDLATGTLKPHDPIYRSTAQLPVEWDPDAVCPVYESWLASSIGDQADDLEESAAQMLDPSQTPTKAVFLYGPSRSGKSTFIRLMEAMAGESNRSAVTLHQLSESRFMAATVYGKILNAAADLSSAAVEDLSIFKLMTGDDAIQGDRKYGGIFTFRNRALFAFSANDPPTVGETSRAYIERIKPFRFGTSFAGREDPSIEAAMMAELPGILVRWVAAWQRRAARGAYLPTRPDVLREFETRSDRVRQWVEENLIVVPVTGGTLPRGDGMSRRELARAFNRWAEDNAGSRMGERKISDRLLHVPGVVEVREDGTKARVLNLRPRTAADVAAESETPSVAEVAVSDHPLQTRETSSEGEGVRVKVGGGEEVKVGEEEATRRGRTKLPLLPPAPTDDLFTGVTVPPQECPDCGQAEETVPPHHFWYACRRCHPGTFTRGG